MKLIGDAAMLTCPDTPTLLEAVLDLVDEMASRATTRESGPAWRGGRWSAAPATTTALR